MAASSRFSPPKLVLWGLVALLVLVGLWYAFRPERLFVNKRVNEAPPAQAAGQLIPLSTGRFTGEVHKTSGRATVYRQADGTRVLRLTDFSTSNGPALHVLLIDGKSPDAGKNFALATIKNVDLGDLKGNQGDQEYRLPNDANLQELSTVSIYCMRFHANFGTAPLEEF